MGCTLSSKITPTEPKNVERVNTNHLKIEVPKETTLNPSLNSSTSTPLAPEGMKTPLAYRKQFFEVVVDHDESPMTSSEDLIEDSAENIIIRASSMANKTSHSNSVDSIRKSLSESLDRQRRESVDSNDSITTQIEIIRNSLQLTATPRNSTSSVNSSKSGLSGDNLVNIINNVSLPSRQASLQQSTAAPFRYRMGSEIGSGSFATVYEAFNIDTGKIIAVKEIDIEGGDEDEKLANAICSEIALLRRFHHENIVQYLGHFRTSNHKIHIFMERVYGGSIASMLKTFGPFREGLILNYIIQICRGVHYLHCKNIVHRDIKGNNVLVNSDSTIKISDFGCSKRLDMIRGVVDKSKPNSPEQTHLTRSNSISVQAFTITGSIPWMAPEIVKNHHSASTQKPVDIWAIGAVIVEMATGNRPWAEFDNQLSILYQIMMTMTGPSMPNVDDDGEAFSEKLIDFVRNKCFAIDPEKRPQISECLDILESIK